VLDYEVIVASRRQAPSALRLNGREIARLRAPAPDTAERWWWDAGTGSVHVTFHAQKFDLELPIDEATASGKINFPR
jgi:hypothetical protein